MKRPFSLPLPTASTSIGVVLALSGSGSTPRPSLSLRFADHLLCAHSIQRYVPQRCQEQSTKNSMMSCGFETVLPCAPSATNNMHSIDSSQSSDRCCNATQDQQLQQIDSRRLGKCPCRRREDYQQDALHKLEQLHQYAPPRRQD